MKAPFWLLFSMVLMTLSAHADGPVGEVTFLIGQVQRVASDGQAHAVESGSKIMEGDLIETGPNGHVHLRFVDQGFVSVRPASRLTIDRYRYDSAKPAGSAVRFTLSQGVVRSITGEAGKVRPERYRLNTPLVAIGVRGTDFVARADSGATHVLLNRGAVVVSPLGANCPAQGLGPCKTRQATLLSEANKGFIVQVRSTQARPRLIGVDPQQVLEMFGIGLHEPQANGNGAPTGAVPVARERLVQGSRDRIGSIGADTSFERPADPVSPKSSLVEMDKVPSTAPTAPPTATVPAQPAPVQAPEPVAPANLVWGRWREPAALSETLSTTYQEASSGRRITVGNQDYGLFRTEGEQRSLPASLSGKADFSLQAGTAQLVRGATADTARIDGGQLQVDFSARRYSTNLQLSAAAAGAHTLHSAGRINDEGIFAEKSAQQWVAGAVAQDGASAGYFFEKSVEAGTFKGLTLWGR